MFCGEHPIVVLVPRFVNGIAGELYEEDPWARLNY
jgi:hypothetical protein